VGPVGLEPTTFYHWYFKPALRSDGLVRVRFHDLRHTYASILFAERIEVHKVSRWMGHASISTTAGIYAHLYATDHSADADRLAVYLEPPYRDARHPHRG